MKFELDKGEREKFYAWNKKHVVEHHNNEEPYSGAIGGRVSFVITSTSMGMILGVQCGICRRQGKPQEIYHETLTDFDDW